MSDSFAPFEKRIRRFASRVPQMPERQVLLTRLYHHVYFNLEQAYDRVLAPFGLNSRTWMPLIMVYANPEEEIKPSDLSRVMTLSRAHITRLADQLVKDGLLVRTPSAVDRRAVHLSLTDAGAALVVRVLPKVWQLTEGIWDGFSEREMALTGELLHKLLGRLAEVNGEGRT